MLSNACDAITVSVWNQVWSFISNKLPCQCHYCVVIEGNQTSKPVSVSHLKTKLSTKVNYRICGNHQILMRCSM